MRKRGVALIGMPGTGKSAVGKRLAAKLGYAYTDTDAMVEKSEGMTVSEIFERHGEPYFRAREREAVAQAATKCAVISCGGGAVCDSENVRVLRENCTVVYLSSSLQTLFAHVRNGEGRPLLKEDVLASLTRLLADREEIYKSAAHCTVMTDGKSLEDVADEVARCVRGGK